MDAQQQPALIDSAYNAEFRLLSNMDVNAAANYLRPEGLLYHIPSLYLSHYGERSPFATNSEVRVAMQTLLVRDNLVNSRSTTVNFSSDRPFDEQELNCLLQALVSGTIQPDLYSERALPLHLIKQLMEYVDQRTNQLMQYATQSDLRNRVEEDREPLALYIATIESDALYLVTTGAYLDREQWYNGFISYINDQHCPEFARLMRNEMREYADYNDISIRSLNTAIIRALMTQRRQRRPTTTTNPIAQSGHPSPMVRTTAYLSGHLRDDPECITPLRRLSMQLRSFLAMIDTSPLREDASPGVSLTSMTNVTAQISVDFGASNPIPLHHRDMSVVDSQRNMFNTNVHRHLNAFPDVNTSGSSSGQQNPMALTPWQMEQFSMLQEEGEAREGTAAVLKPMARPLTRSVTAAERLQSPNYRLTQPTAPVAVPDDDNVPDLRDDDSDEDLPNLINDVGDSDDDDFLPATRRRPPTVPWHRSGRHRVTDDQKKARAQHQAQVARETAQQQEPVMLRQPRSPIIAGLTLETMVQHPQFFDERQVSNQRQYELGLPPMDNQDGKDSEDDSPDQQRYERAIAYLLQSREPSRVAQVDNVTIDAQLVQPPSDEAEEYESRRFYKDDPNYAANPKRMPRTALSHLPTATAAAVAVGRWDNAVRASMVTLSTTSAEVAAPTTRTVYMNANTLEMIPQARVLPSYDELLTDRNQLIAAMEQVARDTEPDWPVTEQALHQPTYALPTPKRVRIERNQDRTRTIIRHGSPPTAPTIVQMVSAQPETSNGYNVNSPAYFVPSSSPSTTPESGQRRPATWSLLDTPTQRRVPAESDRDDERFNPNPTHDPNRG